MEMVLLIVTLEAVGSWSLMMMASLALGPLGCAHGAARSKEQHLRSAELGLMARTMHALEVPMWRALLVRLGARGWGMMP